MHDFSYNGVSLSGLAGRILQAPVHTVAKRNVEMVKIYGRSGDDVIDNESYDNVDFSLKIGFLPHLTAYNAQTLAEAVIDWLAPLQNGYYTYRDTLNNGYFTQALLKNFGEVKRELRTLLTATLRFSRVPYWYSDAGAVAVTAVNGYAKLHNPEQYDAEPVIDIQYTGSSSSNAHMYIKGNGTEFADIVIGGITPTHILDAVTGQHYRMVDGAKVYLSPVLPPNIPANTTYTYSAFIQGHSWGEDFTMQITPNWRRL